MALTTVLYECGCDMATVGQHFEGKGLLVCPEHHKPTRAYQHPAVPFEGAVRLELLVRSESKEAVQVWLDTLVETLLHEQIVTGLNTGTTG